jgi:hypothetical protein
MATRPKLRLIASAALLAVGLATAGAGCVGCPAALLAGELVEQGDELVIVVSEADPAERIIWPFGYSVRSDGERLVLTDLLGGVKARAGDTVRLGGGETESGIFKVCGQLDVDPA